MRQLNVPLQVICYLDDGIWVAHALEFDLIGTGSTPAESLSQMADALDAQVRATVESGSWANLFKPADGQYFARFAAGQPVQPGVGLAVQIGPVTVSDVTVRQYEGTPVLAAI